MIAMEVESSLVFTSQRSATKSVRVWTDYLVGCSVVSGSRFVDVAENVSVDWMVCLVRCCCSSCVNVVSWDLNDGSVLDRSEPLKLFDRGLAITTNGRK